MNKDVRTTVNEGLGVMQELVNELRDMLEREELKQKQEEDNEETNEE